MSIIKFKILLCYIYFQCGLLVFMDEIDDFPNSGSGITQENTQDDDPGPGFPLPGYFIYLSLEFKWIATLFILLMSGWVLFTIKTTTRLHKPHNIFVTNLMITSVIFSLPGTLLSSIMIIVCSKVKGFRPHGLLVYRLCLPPDTPIINNHN